MLLGLLPIPIAGILSSDSFRSIYLSFLLRELFKLTEFITTFALGDGVYNIGSDEWAAKIKCQIGDYLAVIVEKI